MRNKANSRAGAVWRIWNPPSYTNHTACRSYGTVEVAGAMVFDYHWTMNISSTGRSNQ